MLRTILKGHLMHIRSMRLVPLFFCVVFFVLIGFSVYAAELHVGQGRPYSTIGSAITASSSGDTIIVHSGTYNEHSLTPKSNTTVKGATGETKPIVDAQQGAATRISTFDISGVDNIMLENLDIRGGGGIERGSITIGDQSGANNITVSNCKISETNVGGSHTSYNPAHIRISYEASATNVTISNCEMTGSYAAGIKINAILGHADNINVTHCYIHDVIHGVAFKWGTDTNKNMEVTYNIIDGISHRGIYLDQSYVIIENNLIINTDGPAIKAHDNWNGNYNTINHNTFYNCGEGIHLSPTTHDNIITNNIVSESYSSEARSIGIDVYGSGQHNTTIHHNLCYHSSQTNLWREYNTSYTVAAWETHYPSDTGSLQTNPLFTNVTAGDFSLQSASLARNAASDGKDRGADIANVGLGGGSQSPTGVPGAPPWAEVSEIIEN